MWPPIAPASTHTTAAQPPAAQDASPGMPGDWGSRDDADELLGLIFACCHPSLPRESQIALTLRVVCGLTTAEISAAFLASEPAMRQRLSRARKTLRHLNWFEVTEVRGYLNDEGAVDYYQVALKLGFRMEN